MKKWIFRLQYHEEKNKSNGKAGQREKDRWRECWKLISFASSYFSEILSALWLSIEASFVRGKLTENFFEILILALIHHLPNRLPDNDFFYKFRVRWHLQVFCKSDRVYFFQLSDSNPGWLDMKRERYRCAMPSPAEIYIMDSASWKYQVIVSGYISCHRRKIHLNKVFGHCGNRTLTHN